MREVSSLPAPSLRLATAGEKQACLTDRGVPAGVQAVFIWENFADVDGGVPDRLKPVLASAFTCLGEVCFRLFGKAHIETRTLGVLRPSRLPLARAWTVIGSRDPQAVISLLDGAGWSQGAETMIVAPSSDERALQWLEPHRPASLLLEGGELLIEAIVDGAGMLIVAQGRQRMSEAMNALEERCREAGVAFFGD